MYICDIYTNVKIKLLYMYACNAKATSSIQHMSRKNILLNAFIIMPQSHCAESVPERRRMDHSSLSGVSFLVIPVHSYPFE